MIPLLKSVFRHIFDALNLRAIRRRQTKFRKNVAFLLCFDTKDIYGHDIWTAGKSSAPYILCISLGMNFHCITYIFHRLLIDCKLYCQRHSFSPSTFDFFRINFVILTLSFSIFLYFFPSALSTSLFLLPPPPRSRCPLRFLFFIQLPRSPRIMWKLSELRLELLNPHTSKHTSAISRLHLIIPSTCNSLNILHIQVQIARSLKKSKQKGKRPPVTDVRFMLKANSINLKRNSLER